MSHRMGIIIIVSDMGVYNGSHTGEEIDDAIDAVEGNNPTISQLIRDEVKAQLASVVSQSVFNTADIPVFDGNILKFMAYYELAELVGGLRYRSSISSGTLQSQSGKTWVRALTGSFWPSDAPVQEAGFLININLGDSQIQAYLSTSHFCTRFKWFTSGWTAWHIM